MKGKTLRVLMIGPIEFEIRGADGLRDENGDAAAGLYEEGDLFCTVDTSRTPKEIQMAILHEVIHAISYFRGLCLSENKVRCLELDLYQAFEGNYA